MLQSSLSCLKRLLSLYLIKEYRTILLQTVLKGKAQAVYASLLNIQCADCDIAKNTMLKLCEK